MTPARGVAAGVAALACAAALAQPDGEELRRAISQKESLVRRLVYDSPAEARIAASGNGEAIAQLGRARALHARAKALAEAGDHAGAQGELDAAMWSIGKARQLVPDSTARVVDRRVRYAALERSVEALARALDAHVAGAGQGEPGDGARTTLAAARAGIAHARGLASTEHLEEAVRALERTEHDLMRALNALLGSATLRYAKSFATPREEFAFESERNRSYRELVPVAIAELKPRREAVALIERYVAANARALEAAQAHEASGRLREALDALRTGTGNLQAALAAAGLAVPRDMGAH